MELSAVRYTLIDDHTVLTYFAISHIIWNYIEMAPSYDKTFGKCHSTVLQRFRWNRLKI